MNLHPGSTVYAAAIWWSQNDPFIHIVGTSKAKVEREAKRAMKDAARQAYNNEEFETLRAANNTIRWNGVHSFRLADLVSDREYDEAVRDLESGGIYYAEG